MERQKSDISNSLMELIAQVLKEGEYDYPIMYQSFVKNERYLAYRVIIHARNRNLSIQDSIAELEKRTTSPIDLE